MPQQLADLQAVSWFSTFIDSLQSTAINVKPDAVAHELARSIAAVPRPVNFVDLMFVRGVVLETCVRSRCRMSEDALKNLAKARSLDEMLICLEDSTSRRVEHVSRKPRGDHPALESAIRTIEERYAEPNLHLSSVAAVSRISPWHLERLFSRNLGTTFSQHLRTTRVSRAADLLQNTDLSIKEIAWTVGFNGSSQLIRSFKEALHLTPGKYRRRYRD